MIAAEGEHKASSALKEAAHVIEDSPHALQVTFITSISGKLGISGTRKLFWSDFELFNCNFKEQAKHTNQ